jgi:hypothetical protein
VEPAFAPTPARELAPLAAIVVIRIAPVIVTHSTLLIIDQNLSAPSYTYHAIVLRSSARTTEE